MGSVSLSGSLSMGRIAEGHCVCALASSALLLYRNALIDIPEVLINKRTHSFLTLMGFALLASLFFLAFNRSLRILWASVEAWKHRQCCGVCLFFFFSVNCVLSYCMKCSKTMQKLKVSFFLLKVANLQGIDYEFGLYSDHIPKRE